MKKNPYCPTGVDTSNRRRDGKIALTEWLERFFHKDAEYREKYLIDTGRGYVLNWEQLDKDHMILKNNGYKG